MLFYTDSPLIVSGDRLAFFDPEEKIFGTNGKDYNLCDVITQHFDFIAPINGVAGFESSSVVDKGWYNSTIFRLPLRTEPSEISSSLYDLTKMKKLLNALRNEAKYLLLFLKSVLRIEVYHIAKNHKQSLSFCVEFDNEDHVCEQRSTFNRKLEDIHNKMQSFKISEVVCASLRLSVVVTDRNRDDNQGGTSEWFVCNSVGCTDSDVLEAAKNQCTFPAVGTALELGQQTSGGRIFCLLPIPPDVFSGLPVHINGPFGLNDDRRSLTWPTIERENDSSARWNKTIVSKLLPPCYTRLLVEVRMHISNPEDFYKAWPIPQEIHEQFADIARPLFTSLLKESVFWTERSNDWVSLNEAVFIGIDVINIISKVLLKCGVNVVSVPIEIWEAIKSTKQNVVMVTPENSTSVMRLHPESYNNLTPTEKKHILSYFLSAPHDSSLNLLGLHLLPLADGNFACFQEECEPIYLCTKFYPRYLLPGLDCMLVNELPELQESLKILAVSQKTNLRLLTLHDVAKLLPQILSSENAMFNNEVNITREWLRKLWNWLCLDSNETSLHIFQDSYIVPYWKSKENTRDSFFLMKLNKEQPVIYIDHSEQSIHSKSFISALYKLNIGVCFHSEFRFVSHTQLSSYVKLLNGSNILDAAIASQCDVSGIVFTQEEAETLRSILIKISSPLSDEQQAVFKNFAIFTSATCLGNKLFSVTSAAVESIAKKPLGEPSKPFTVHSLPSSFVLLTRDQFKLLELLDVTFPTESEMLVDHVFPLLQNFTFPLGHIDQLMENVIASLHAFSSDVPKIVRNLSFIKIKSGKRVTPQKVFDSRNPDLLALYEGEDCFPLKPFNSPERLQLLQQCGLRTSVTPQEVLEIIHSISCDASSEPQQVRAVKLRRAKAVIKYISDPAFQQLLSNDPQCQHSFSNDLTRLSTQRCWLPVLYERHSNYPKQLLWKGNTYPSHFVSLSSSNVAIVGSNSSNLSLLVGTRCCFVDFSNKMLHLLMSSIESDPAEMAHNALTQFSTIIDHKELTNINVDIISEAFYSFMNNEGVNSLEELKLIDRWVFIHKHDRFVSPDMVTLQRDSFDYEPYLYILPNKLLEYENVFNVSMGFTETVTETQLLQVLKTINLGPCEKKMVTAKIAWKMVTSILSVLTANEENLSAESFNSQVLIPVETDSDWPHLEKVSNVVYTDNEFLKGHLDLLESNCSLTHKQVHKNITPELANCLGATSASKLYEVYEDTFEDTGQHEPLTVRLKNILRDYKDGLTIIKELLQNADDADATEVNICYDARQHETDPAKLFFGGMAEAHGPALIVHNNKPFSDDDFINITKLAGATKQSNALKIGKFGVGFCSAYHMTDIPSFVSQEHLYIFDPTLSYLKKEINNPAQPGKKAKFTNKLISGSQQLDPYNGLFGFNATQSYAATMFRFPFRSRASELSGSCYSHATVDELILNMKNCSSKLLLFLRNVKAITFQHIASGQHEPQTLLKIVRDVVPLQIPLYPNTHIRKITVCARNHTSICHWLVSQTDGYDSQQRYNTASVACPLGSSVYTIDPNFEGEVFCFLPLSQKTGLPVHINSNFAVINNRRGIWISDEATAHNDKDVEWNIALIDAVITPTYHTLLLVLKELNSLIPGYSFHDLWPKSEKLLQSNPWERMISKLYELISCESIQLFYSKYSKQWLELSASRFLAPGIFCLPSNHIDTPVYFLKVLQHLKQPIVALPSSYHAFFNFEKEIVDESVFSELFFANLNSLKPVLQHRNKVICCILEIYASESDDRTKRWCVLDNYFRNNACIPCTPTGEILRHCTKVINPTTDFANLYDDSESFVPIPELSNRKLCLSALVELGMICKTIPYGMLVERAKTVCCIYKSNKKKAMNRVKHIVMSCTKTEEKESDLDLSSVPFLPVLQKPKKYILSWKGEGDGEVLMCGKNLMIESPTNIDLAGSQVAFVGDRDIDYTSVPRQTIALLGLREFPSFEEVLAQLTDLQAVFMANQFQMLDEISTIGRMCMRMYDFLDKHLPLESCSIQISHLWNEKQFVEIDIISKDWTRVNGPYLYGLPASMLSRKNLIASLKLKVQFSFEDIHKAAQKMKNEFDNRPVDENCQTILQAIITLLHNLDFSASKRYTLLLPDEHYVLCQSDTLTYNDVDWTEKDPHCRYVHDIVPAQLAKKLGVQPARGKLLQKFISSNIQFKSIEFGQREQLTRRIQNILQDYPFDITILKELLQNADDAKATKMYIILDMRTHGKQGVLTKNWERLQGPALLVWNDSVFTEKDLQGIQELGLGSKRSSTETIGQYGIGFNVVYHLTDCPSFITGGETMCILDPHCEYVHEADTLYPGRRYENLSQGFWTCFPDMSSTYLRSGLENCPSELKHGSLFRFPLRHTNKHLEHSKIVCKDKFGKPIENIMTSPKMLKSLQLWAPRIKESMLFLNHIRKIQLMVIEEGSKEITIKHKYCSRIVESDQKRYKQMHKEISSFTSKEQNKSFIITYPLKINDVYLDSAGQEVSTNEEWLIQQGVGDLSNEKQLWSFVNTIKPRHGIAAPIKLPLMPQTSSSERPPFLGKIFCFLPLPIVTKLPVHINGNFILNSTRRDLWLCTEKGREDDKSTWNCRLFQAIASSYVNLLEHAQSYYISSLCYETFSLASDDISKYYKIFPSPHHLEKQYRAIVYSVYEKIVEQNLKILASVNSTSRPMGQVRRYCVDWLPPKSSDPSTQVYFQSSVNHRINHEETNKIKIILEDIGMKVTVASTFLLNHLNDAVTRVNVENTGKIKKISPETVFDYYIQFYSKQSQTGHFPCAISQTTFKTVSAFKTFIRYLLQPSSTNQITDTSTSSSPVTTMEFPKEPFGYPLLLTADNQLRTFQKTSKVLNCSRFWDLFESSPECFLHPDLGTIEHSRCYFVYPPLSEHSQLQIEMLFSKHFPPSLKANRVQTFPTDFSKAKLSRYWRCLFNDQVFCSSMGELLKEWALLPSTSGSLHSCSDCLLPVVPPTCQNKAFADIYDVLCKIGMPILDTSIVVDYEKLSCPSLSDKPSILKALYHLNEEANLSIILNDKVDVIISYLQELHFLKRIERDHVKSLPLFKSVDGTLRSLQGKSVYVWPAEAITCGYSEWSKHFPEVIFLIETGMWERLGSLKVLKIETLTIEELYCKFIFSYFSILSEEDRYSHLKYIREHLFVKHLVLKETYNYGNFLSKLENLCCIGTDNLKPISSYCNHEIDIFATFSEDFVFLPILFKDSELGEWLKFFKKLGLKQTVSQEKFLQLCTKIKNGNHANPAKAADVLLSYLLSDSEKHRDDIFLNQVAQIPFVPTKPLPKLAWIAKPQYGSFTKLSEAATHDCAVYLWNIKPIIKLPSGWRPLSIAEHRTLAEKLDIICKPDIQDVMQNILKLCSLRNFTSFQHFYLYPNTNEPPSGVLSLMEVMIKNLSRLETNQKYVTDSLLQSLRNSPCIPVNITGDKTHSWQVLLVKPCYVLRGVPVAAYHPYLHELDHRLSAFTFILQQLKVESEVGFSHIQLVLNKAYEIQCSTGQVLDKNTSGCVFSILSQLRHNLYHQSERLDEVLYPLYLPNHDEKLALSTKLLYVDDDTFKGKLHPKLDGTGYSMLKIRSTIPEIGTDILMSEKDFCDLLPKRTRPVGLSELCTLRVLPECVFENNTEVGKLLTKTFDMKATLSKAISAGVQYYTRLPSKIVEAATLHFFSNTEIETLNYLRMAVCFKTTGQTLGNLDTKFHLQVLAGDSYHACLYLNSKLKAMSHVYVKIIGVLSTKLLNLIRSQLDKPELLTREVSTSLMKLLSDFLNAHSPQDIQDILEDNSIPLVEVEMNDADFTLGKEVSECWHHRLDQTIENVFHPGEIVGYEVVENHIVFAMIMHPVLPKELPSFDSIQIADMQYMILTHDDEQQEKAGIFELYKFLKGIKYTQCIEGRDANQIRDENTDREQKITELKKQLVGVWKLSEELRTRALRRLCLKWHPDKNIDNPVLAETVFKILNEEISDKNVDHGIFCEELRKTARKQREFYRREQESRLTSETQAESSSSLRELKCAEMPKFDEESLCPKQNPEEGRRWLQQADANFESLLLLFSECRDKPRVCGDICFMAHQVAEKALKAGKYFVCGLDEISLRSRSLSTHALGLQFELPNETRGLAAHTTPLEEYYLNPRYPNCWPSPRVPAEQYNYEEAEGAKNHAQIILDIIKNILSIQSL